MTVPNDRDLAWFYSSFLAFAIRKTAADWQQFVTDMMFAKHGGQFLQVDPTGRGDKGCDGWVDGLMLACYGAKNADQRSVTAKMKSDFWKAHAYWGLRMQTWAFVHNDSVGLPYMAVEGLIDVRRSLAAKGVAVTVEAWPPQVLWDYCTKGLSREQLANILGAPPSDHPAGMTYIARCVESLARTRLPPDLNAVPTVPYGKIEYNGFSEEVGNIITGMGANTSHVHYYFSQASPGEQAQASLILQAKFDKYRALLGRSDAIFHALCDDLVTEAFADGTYGDREQQRSAAIMVVTYYFEVCDIFDSPREGAATNASPL